MNNGHVRFYLKRHFRTDCTLADGRPTTVNILDSDENGCRLLESWDVSVNTTAFLAGNHSEHCKAESTSMKVHAGWWVGISSERGKLSPCPECRSGGLMLRFSYGLPKPTPLAEIQHVS